MKTLIITMYEINVLTNGGSPVALERNKLNTVNPGSNSDGHTDMDFRFRLI